MKSAPSPRGHLAEPRKKIKEISPLQKRIFVELWRKEREQHRGHIAPSRTTKAQSPTLKTEAFFLPDERSNDHEGTYSMHAVGVGVRAQ